MWWLAFRAGRLDPVEQEHVLAAEEAEVASWSWAALAIWWVVFLVALFWLIIAAATAA